VNLLFICTITNGAATMNEQPQKRSLVAQPLPGYPPEIGHWLWAMEDSRRRTREALDGISPDAIDYSTPCIDNTIGTLLYHIAAVEADWLYAEVMEQEFPPEIAALFPWDMRDASGRLSVATGLTLDEHYARLAAVRTALLTCFRPISVTDFHRERTLPHYWVTPAWVLHHLCQHEAEHRGQILEARRLVEQTVKNGEL
jgi:uncharacterized damage-inducible protein DinB